MLGWPGARLPWFVPGRAAGLLVVGGGEAKVPHRLEVRVGVLPAGMTVAVEAAGRAAEVTVGAVVVGRAVSV